MKKVIALVTVVLFCSITTLMAQGGGGGQQMTPEQRTAMMKDRLKPLGLTDLKTDSVIAIYSDRSMMAGMTRDTPQEERQAKMKEVNEAREKRMAKAGLSADEIKKVAELMSQQRPGGGRGGGGGSSK